MHGGGRGQTYPGEAGARHLPRASRLPGLGSYLQILAQSPPTSTRGLGGVGPSSAPVYTPGSQHLLVLNRDLLCPPRRQAPAGGWTVTEAAVRPRVGAVNPVVAEAGASIAPLFGWGH